MPRTLLPTHEPPTIGGLLSAIAANEKTAKDIVKENLDAINSYDRELNSLTAINDKALDEAEELDRLEASKRGPLHGITVIVKDQIETAGLPTTFGSALCQAYTPTADATLVRRLKAAGALILAKSTMPDWATSWFSTSSLSTTTANPHDLTRDPGGSSSGTAAAIAAGLAVVGIGGDTGGSIRLPSSFCGLVGVRVTPGRISRAGMSSLVTPQDTPGPMARTVADAARVLDVLVGGFDEADEYTAINALRPVAPGAFLAAVESSSSPSSCLRGRRLGVLRQVFGEHRGVRGVLDAALERMRAAGGAELVEVEIPRLEHFVAVTSVYGTRSRADIDAFVAARPALAHLRFADMHARGEYHKALDLMDVIAGGREDFEADPALAGRLLAQEEFRRLVAGVFAKHGLDAVVYPTCQLVAPRTKDVLGGRWTCLTFPTNTVIASQLLFPAVSVPVGKAVDDEEPEGPSLPVGLEILGLPLQEEVIMAIAAGVESVS